VKRLSLIKANQAKLKYKNSFILAADTIVYSKKRFFSKTDDINIAFNNIKLLSGGRHTVYTGLTFINSKEQINFYLTKTRIKFKKLNDQEVKEYLLLEEWKNSAGSYAIQGYASSFINFISGSYTSAIGLPLEKVYNILKNNKLL
jgi:septum formation protein